jgi:hypothetical protein
LRDSWYNWSWLGNSKCVITLRYKYWYEKWT